MDLLLIAGGFVVSSGDGKSEELMEFRLALM